MDKQQPLVVFWFRRDLRLDDNAGLYHALKSGSAVLPVFIFDKEILSRLEDKDDARVTFIYQAILTLDRELQKLGSSLLVMHDTPAAAWEKLLTTYQATAVYTNHDYESYAQLRDSSIRNYLKERGAEFNTYKDQVIFERDEVVKDDGKPYTVYTPYMRKWIQQLTPFYTNAYPTKKYAHNFFKTAAFDIPTLQQIGFEKHEMAFPPINYKELIPGYAENRDFPAVNGTTHIGLHLRFGTVSIRELAHTANEFKEKTWLNELIWREFYMMILYHFPGTADHAFRPEYDRIRWINDEQQFEAWCRGETGFPLVDAGMRELNATGYMHNRVRMVVASFLSKDLLIDWRWGERYFARRLLDYELASNVGGWQWAAGSGTDAAPYFRIFNPESQLKKFDPKLEYIKKWVPEYADFSTYPKPIVDHAFARERCLKAFKEALAK
ncbi:MAG: cryptochrome/photolyase family protein [Mucilaginibacter sp.]